MITYVKYQRGEKELDLAEYGAAADRIGRILQRLGLSRTMRDVTSEDRGLDVITSRVNKLDEDETTSANAEVESG